MGETEKKSFPGKKRGIRILLLAVLIAAAVLVNLLAQAAEQRWGLRFDLSADQLTAFSDKTREIVSQVEEPVTIYLLFRSGTRSELRVVLEELTARYSALNPKIHTEVIDPVTSPGRVFSMTENAQELTEGSLLVANKDATRVKTILAGELYNYQFDQASQAYAQSSFIGESKLTSAIQYVCDAETPIVYLLTGHNEVDMGYASVVCHELESENYDVLPLDLAASAPQAGDTVVVLAPSLDLTDGEYQVLLSWLEAGGRLFFLNDATKDLAQFPNFSRLLAYYGLSMPYGMVVEDSGSAGRYLQSPLYIVPQMNGESDITGSLMGGRVVLPFTGCVSRPDVAQPGFDVEVLLRASATSYMKSMDSVDDFMNREAADPAGPFDLAVSMVRYNPDGSQTRLVVMNNVYTFIDSNYLYSTYNLDYTMQCFDFLINKESAVYIRSKALASTGLFLPNAAAFYRLSILIAVILPAAVLLVGLAVYLKRRKL